MSSKYDGRCGVYGASSDYDDEDGGMSFYEVKSVVAKAVAGESQKTKGLINSIIGRVSAAERANKILLNQIVNLRLAAMEEKLTELRQAIPRFENKRSMCLPFI